MSGRPSKKRRRNPKRGDVVLVRWLDSCTPGRKWQYGDFMEEYQPAECVSVGLLGRRDKKALVLAGSWTSEEVGHVLAIPAACVQSIEVLRTKGEL